MLIQLWTLLKCRHRDCRRIEGVVLNIIITIAPIMVCNGYGFRNALYLNNLKLLNISVMVVSVFMLFVGYDLLTNYFMDSRFFSALGFEFWPISVLPVVFIGIGLATLITSVGCFICSVFQSKRPVIGYAILMMFLVLGKFGCLFLTFKAQGLIERKLTYITKSEPDDKIVKLYSNDKKSFGIIGMHYYKLDFVAVGAEPTKTFSLTRRLTAFHLVVAFLKWIAKIEHV